MPEAKHWLATLDRSPNRSLYSLVSGIAELGSAGESATRAAGFAAAIMDGRNVEFSR
jgi:hypothetical protein